MTQPPKRLLESAELSGQARRLLEQGRVQAPVTYDVAAGMERFQAALATAAFSGAGAANGRGSLIRLHWLKLCLLLSPAILGASVVLGPWRQAPAPHPAAVTQSSIEVPMSAAASPSPLPPEQSSPAGVGTPLVVPELEPAAVSGGDTPARRDSKRTAVDGTKGARAAAVHSDRPRFSSARRARAERAMNARTSDSSHAAARSESTGPARAAAPSRASASSDHAAASGNSAQPDPTAARVPETTDSIGELEGLARARSLVRREPRAAIELLERLARAHPHGYFVEEREALYVIALADDNQHGKASQLGAAFLRKYPASPLAGNVRNAVDR